MSTLVSPGVLVTVSDDSAYAESGSGTVPLVIFATAQDKIVPGTTSTVAVGTTKANAGTVYVMSSQQDVLTTFGTPIFMETSGTVNQGDELNEYGLHALFSAMGLTNSAYAVRADIDLNELVSNENEARSAPLNQTFWINPTGTSFGLFYYDSSASNPKSAWVKATVNVPLISEISNTGVPLSTFGAIDTYAFVPYLDASGSYTNSTYEVDGSKVVESSKLNRWFYKSKTTNTWTEISSQITYKATSAPVDSSNNPLTNYWVKTDSLASGMSFVNKKYNASNASWANVSTYSALDYVELEAGIGSTLAIGNVGLVTSTLSNTAESYASPIFNQYTSTAVVSTTMTSANITFNTDKYFRLEYSDSAYYGIQYFEFEFTTITDLVSAINTKTTLGAVATINGSNTNVTITSPSGRAFRIFHGVTSSSALTRLDSSNNWSLLSYYFQTNTPSTPAIDGTYWYDSNLYADIMINDGLRWRALQSTGGKAVLPYIGGSSSSVVDIQIETTQPDTKADGVSALLIGDIWINPLDAGYEFHQYQADGWFKLDSTDQSTISGILFADARSSDAAGVGYFNYSQSTAYAALIASDYVDPTCPDPRKYPKGMLMCNLGQTGGVVRKRSSNPFTAIDFTGSYQYYVGDSRSYPVISGYNTTPLTLATINGDQLGRWVTESGTAANGSGLFGRKAQRKVITQAMAATIQSNEHLRSEVLEFNLMAAPGYVELLDDLVTLNTDRKETAYIITDVPARLLPTSTSISNWASNSADAVENGDDGRITAYSYAAQYMGWGYGTNSDGTSVAIPGSTIALRTYLYSDSVSYVWFPPAGTERGVVTNASSVGYITSENEYAAVVYNQGQRDTMYSHNINPIAYRPGRGLLVWGDKSLASSSTALDRVNVGRLVVYIRTEIAKIADRFLFKLNTARVRSEFAAALTSFLANIVQLEGIEDFSVVCDSTNNTTTRINQNQLWADIAIVPTKSINFIYVPIRLTTSINSSSTS